VKSSRTIASKGMHYPFRGLLAAVGLTAFALLAASPALADEERGRAIAEAAHERSSGFGDLSATAVMLLRTASGQEAERALSIRILDLPGEAGRGLTIVESPRDVRGTALLTHTDENGAQDQWLYLPATSRTRRIASENRSGAFMGSEFSYDDFSAQTPSRYNFRFLRDEKLDGIDCHVLHREEIDGLPGHQIVWMDTEHLRLQRVEFFDARGNPQRTLTVSDYRSYEGPGGREYWRADALLMENVRTGAATTLHWKEIQLDTGLRERDFEVSALGRAR
jgi:outer membrane lipoprotein-sorting protein